MDSPGECLIMAKPAGPRCNMRCGYCYYLEKDALFPGGQRVMAHELLESFIRQRLAASPGPNIHFEWHGGEPTLLGIEYFQTIRDLQRRHAPPGRTVTNGLQTNGLLLDERWAYFLAREGFSVGLSLDGPADLHDCFRTTADGSPTHVRVANAFRLLKRYRVFCNVLCVIHAANATEPDRVYDFFRDLGASYLQFLPLTRRPEKGDATSATAEPDAIGRFLCRIFDRWIREDVGRRVIQNIDEALRPLFGVPHALCIHRETCGNAVVLEHDGSLYACDHFVLPAYRIGNLRERPLSDLVADPALRQFGAAKRQALPGRCKDCTFLDACNGGCPKDRIVEIPEEPARLNVLCPAYMAFFAHSRPELARLAAHMKAGRSLRGFLPA